MPSCPTDPAFFTESWQFEHVDVSRILSHTSVTFCPSGRKSYSTFAKYDFCTFVGMPTTLVRLRLPEMTGGGVFGVSEPAGRTVLKFEVAWPMSRSVHVPPASATA